MGTSMTKPQKIKQTVHGYQYSGAKTFDNFAQKRSNDLKKSHSRKNVSDFTNAVVTGTETDNQSAVGIQKQKIKQPNQIILDWKKNAIKNQKTHQKVQKKKLDIFEQQISQCEEDGDEGYVEAVSQLFHSDLPSGKLKNTQKPFHEVIKNIDTVLINKLPPKKEYFSHAQTQNQYYYKTSATENYQSHAINSQNYKKNYNIDLKNHQVYQIEVNNPFDQYDSKILEDKYKRYFNYNISANLRPNYLSQATVVKPISNNPFGRTLEMRKIHSQLNTRNIIPF